MDTKTTEELESLRREVKRLERYRRIVYGQLFLSEKMARFVTLLWFGPNLVQAIHNVISARQSGVQPTEVEIAHLIAAVLRRMLRIGLIAAFIAILPVAILVWQNTLMRQQVVESRRHTVEIVHHNRKTELSGYLSQIGRTLSTMIDSPYGDRGKSFREVMNGDDFIENCGNKDTAEYEFTDKVSYHMISYVRILSELYLLDIKALDPLSDTISEINVTQHHTTTSPTIHSFAIRVNDILTILANCRASMKPLATFVRWNSDIDNREYHRYMIPATDIRYKYGIAKRNIFVNQIELIPDPIPVVKVKLLHSVPRQINDVIVRCLVSLDGTTSSPPRDLASQDRNVGSLGKNEEREVVIPFPALADQELHNAKANCMIDSAIAEDPDVTTLR